MPEFETVLYETPIPKVARIVLNRPEARNAQNTQLLYDLNAAFDVAAQDDEISVIVLAANGPHFSSGHDLRERGMRKAMASKLGARFETVLSETLGARGFQARAV
jgi:enoyl-CoA hydratase/carnithine racemase